MKNIKHFKYINTYSFQRFLCKNGYALDDVSGYSIGWKEQHNGNLLRVYVIYFNKGEYKLFSVLYFKNFNEYEEVSSGSKFNKTLSWYDGANIAKYKYGNRYIIAKC